MAVPLWKPKPVIVSITDVPAVALVGEMLTIPICGVPMVGGTLVGEGGMAVIVAVAVAAAVGEAVAAGATAVEVAAGAAVLVLVA